MINEKTKILILIIFLCICSFISISALILNIKHKVNNFKTESDTKSSIAILIPGTSNDREWKSIEDSSLFKIFIKSFVKNLDQNLNFKIFFGIDKGDKIYDNINNQNFIKQYFKRNNINNVQIDFIIMNIEKGFLSKMWNKLFKIAYNENFEYFYQCGDDITFKDKDMFKSCIKKLEKLNNIGVTGPYTVDTTRILTQSFVSRKHMEIFGFYFPEEIKNWFVDDWITLIYKKKYFNPLGSKYKISNDGGNPRYDVEQINVQKIVDKYKPKLDNYVLENK